VTEPTRVEQAPQESEARFRTLAATVPVPIVVTRGSDGTMLFANEAMAAMVGIPHSQLLGRRAGESYRDPAVRERFLAQSRRDGYVHDFEIGGGGDAARDRWAAVSARRITYDGEQAVFTTFYEITARKRLEAALRTNEAFLRAVLERSPDAIVSLDVAARAPKLLSRETFCGYGHGDFEAGANLVEVVHADDRLIVQRNWLSVTSGADDWAPPIEYRLRAKSGGWEWIRQRARTLTRDAQGRPSQVLFFLTVISDAKAREAQQREQDQRLQQWQ